MLLVDTDTQSNVSLSLGIDGYKRSLADVLMRRTDAFQCLLHARENLDLLPGSIDLFKAQQRLVLESASDGIFGVDAKGKAIFINGSAAELLGFE